MDLKIKWHNPIELRDGSKEWVTYICDPEDLKCIPEKPGVYFFGLLYGKRYTPLYIGKATVSLRQRIKSHINADPKLMNKIKAVPRKGRRVLVVGEFQGRQGQQAKKMVGKVEIGLIRYAINQDYLLFNKHGTSKVPVNKIISKRSSPFPEELSIEAK